MFRHHAVEGTIAAERKDGFRDLRPRAQRTLYKKADLSETMWSILFSSGAIGREMLN